MEERNSGLQWSQMYPPQIAGSILTGAGLRQFCFSPDFDMGPRQNLYTNSVTITMTGSYRLDFCAANLAANLIGKPKGYTWHHLFSANGLTTNNGKDYQCKMQLIKSSIHRITCPHMGAVAQWVAIKGTEYKSVFQEDIPCTFTKNTFPIEKEMILEGVPRVIAELTENGFLGGDARFSFRFGNEQNHAIEVYDTYGVLTNEEIKEFKKASNVVKEMNKLGLYPVGEDQAGNLVFYDEVLNQLWIYDHEHVLNYWDQTGQVMYPTGVTFKDIFG